MPTIAHEVGHHLHKILFPEARTPKGELSSKAFPKQYHSELAGLAYEGAPNKVTEGYAEFVRLWMTDPAKARAQAPMFSKHFEGMLDANPQIKKVLTKAQTDVAKWIEQPAEQRVESTLSRNEPSVKRGVTLDSLYTQWIDELRPLEQAEKAITGGSKPQGL
jgi:hypothetical protein